MSTVRDQLHIVHDPFSDTTNQPKIPDGKVNDSLGLHCKDVREFRNSEDGTFGNVMHMLLFAGQNTCLVVRGSDAPTSTRTYFAPGFVGAGAANWVGYADGQSAFSVSDPEEYALWRTVSAGLQLKLLNPVEEDDGWWEAVRINEPLDNVDWLLSTVNDETVGTTKATDGAVLPVGLLEQLSTKSISNDPTYSTGLLRDLHRVQFELHGRLDYHDFTQRKQTMRLDEESFNSNPIVNNELSFVSGHDDVHEMINNFVDKSYDMIYVRLHCRENDTGEGSSLQGSRFHTNMVSNQEIYWPVDARENRFHTKSETIGAGAMSIHFQGRRSNQNAATLIGA